MTLDRISGHVLFPSPVQGPWLPMTTFAESDALGPVSPDPHPHASEEVLNYVLDGSMLYEDDSGYRQILGPRSAALFSTGVERRHDLRPEGSQRARWVSIVVRFPGSGNTTGSETRVAAVEGPVAIAPGVSLRTVAGPSGGARTQSGLRVASVEFSEARFVRLPLNPDERAAAYVLAGSGMIAGAPTGPSHGLLVDGADALEVSGTPGFWLLLASVPRPVWTTGASLSG